MPDDVPPAAGHSGLSSAAPSRDALQDVNDLRVLLGNAFVAWVLADPGPTLTPAQAEAATALMNVVRQHLVERPDLPYGASLLAYHQESGTTFLNYCRRCADGTIEPAAGSSSDSLLNSLLIFAAECYGEMLLPTDSFHRAPDFHYYVRTQSGRDLVRAIREEQILPVGFESDYAELGDSEGKAFFSSMRPGMFASGLIWCAWNLARLDTACPSLAQFAAKVPVALGQLRSCFSGKSTAVTSVASLTGARLPDGTEIKGTWGRIRPARKEDHPASLRPFAGMRTVSTTESGDQVEITDAGDIIFETTVHVSVKVNDEGNGWSSSGDDDLGELIDRVRLAFALATNRPATPVMFCMWATTLLPMGNLEARPLTDPKFMAPRTPVRLDASEIESWRHWIDVVMAADMSRLKVAMNRTLRAMAERRDQSDRLIDAVIAWESLFGATNESTLRVSASLARLLHPQGKSRETARERYNKIYQARSNIVHANETKTSAAQLDEYGKEAIEASLRVMALLLGTHKELLPLKSSARSIQVLLGADSPFQADPADLTASEDNPL